MALWADLSFVIASRFLVLLDDDIKSLLIISKTVLKKQCSGKLHVVYISLQLLEASFAATNNQRLRRELFSRCMQTRK
jgi:hypothetical protein